MLRPLEYAANNGILGLTRAYLLTPSMYIIREENRGIATYQWIDVTEYESFDEGNRMEWSPLLCLTLLDKDRLKYPSTADFFTDPILTKWIRNKYVCAIIPVLLFILVRCVLIAIFFIVDSDMRLLEEYALQNDNSTANTTFCTTFQSIVLSPVMSRTLCLYLIAHTSCTVLFDIVELLRNYRPRHLCLLRRFDKSFKNIFLQYEFYRRVSLVISALVCARAVLILMGTDPRADSVNFTRIVTRVALWWPFLYFMQLVPLADFHVIAVQNILNILGPFCAVNMMFVFGFAHLFMIEINVNLKQGCAPQFIDVPSSLYSTFLAMLDMMDFTQFDVTNPVALYVIHVLFVLFVSIMLLNFLIAIMTDSVSEISKNKDVILPMQKLSVLLALERQCKRIGVRYFRWIQRKVFVVYDNRLCIVRMTFNNHGPNDLARNAKNNSADATG